MILQTDKEGKAAVIQLCDIALKQGGLQIMQGVTQILGAIKELPPESQDEGDDSDKEQTD